jgi:hypothetical protein
MTTITITVDGSEYPKEVTENQLVGLEMARVQEMAELPIGDDQEPGTPVEDRLGYIPDRIDYLQMVVQRWATRHPEEASPDGVRACIGRCVTSWERLANGEVQY